MNTMKIILLLAMIMFFNGCSFKEQVKYYQEKFPFSAYVYANHMADGMQSKLPYEKKYFDISVTFNEVYTSGNKVYLIAETSHFNSIKSELKEINSTSLIQELKKPCTDAKIVSFLNKGLELIMVLKKGSENITLIVDRTTCSDNYDQKNNIFVNGYNLNGYDLKGYDSEGYDSGGYDLKGYDKKGQRYKKIISNKDLIFDIKPIYYNFTNYLTIETLILNNPIIETSPAKGFQKGYIFNNKSCKKLSYSSTIKLDVLLESKFLNKYKGNCSVVSFGNLKFYSCSLNSDSVKEFYISSTIKDRVDTLNLDNTCNKTLLRHFEDIAINNGLDIKRYDLDKK